jgi:type VI secretion system secreted protein Hcp
MDGMDRFEEHITLNFRQVEVTYTPQDGQGVGGGSSSAGWDIAANKSVG